MSFWSKPTRRFTVHGTVNDRRYDTDDVRRKTFGSVTLRAKNHDAAEEEARTSFHEGDDWFAYRWFEVSRVVEHRRRG